MKTETLWETLRYKIIPPVFLLLFPCCVQILASIGQDEPLSLGQITQRLLGNTFGWICVVAYSLWAAFWLWLPGKVSKGPRTYYGYIPVYKDNGLAYYLCTTAAVILLGFTQPALVQSVFINTPEILAACNIVALALCVLLFIKGLHRPDVKGEKNDLPLPFLFYQGIDLHPRFLGIDVKQFTNSRFGVMSWQVLILFYWMASFQRDGLNPAVFSHNFPQTVYLFIAFASESTYFHSLDITLDRAGFYMVWGCMVWIPCFLAYSSYQVVLHPPTLKLSACLFSLIVSISLFLLRWLVDKQRENFRAYGDKPFYIWGRQATSIAAEYTDTKGKKHRSRLLTSGAWGLARHLNYTLETLATLFWCLPLVQNGLHGFLWWIMLTIILVHRVFRDEQKCSTKYGMYWKEYCKKVPWRMIPFIF